MSICHLSLKKLNSPFLLVDQYNNNFTLFTLTNFRDFLANRTAFSEVENENESQAAMMNLENEEDELAMKKKLIEGQLQCGEASSRKRVEDLPASELLDFNELAVAMTNVEFTLELTPVLPGGLKRRVLIKFNKTKDFETF